MPVCVFKCIQGHSIAKMCVLLSCLLSSTSLASFPPRAAHHKITYLCLHDVKHQTNNQN